MPPKLRSFDNNPRMEEFMKRQVMVLVLVVGGIAFISGCDSGKVESTKSEPAATSEPAAPAEPSTESTMEPTMESGAPTAEPGALLAAPEAAGAAENNEGVDHYQQGHMDVAQEHFQKALAANAGLAEAHYNLALVLDKLGNHGEAKNHFKMALDNAPDNPSIRDSGILKAHLGG